MKLQRITEQSPSFGILLDIVGPGKEAAASIWTTPMAFGTANGCYRVKATAGLLRETRQVISEIILGSTGRDVAYPEGTMFDDDPAAGHWIVTAFDGGCHE